jgi:four helix bundle protein
LVLGGLVQVLGGGCCGDSGGTQIQLSRGFSNVAVLATSTYTHRDSAPNQPGMDRDAHGVVTARHHRELEAWQLSHQVRLRMIDLVSRPQVARNFDFVNQTETAARSACRNIAEGFWRYQHPQFAQYLNIAKSSLGELLDSVDEALARNYVTSDEYELLNKLVSSALASTTSLHRYVSTTPTPPSKSARSRRRKPPGNDRVAK